MTRRPGTSSAAKRRTVGTRVAVRSNRHCQRRCCRISYSRNYGDAAKGHPDDETHMSIANHSLGQLLPAILWAAFGVLEFTQFIRQSRLLSNPSPRGPHFWLGAGALVLAVRYLLPDATSFRVATFSVAAACVAA